MQPESELLVELWNALLGLPNAYVVAASAFGAMALLFREIAAANQGEDPILLRSTFWFFQGLVGLGLGCIGLLSTTSSSNFEANRWYTAVSFLVTFSSWGFFKERVKELTGRASKGGL